MRKTHVIVHCTASRHGTVREVRRWHLARGMKDIAYAYLVSNGRPNGMTFDPTLVGVVWPGRDTDGDGDTEDEVGAHALGINRQSIGVCMVGGHEEQNDFPPRQVEATARLVADICTRHKIPVAHVLGHRELPGVAKACPVIDMNVFRERVAQLLEESVGE